MAAFVAENTRRTDLSRRFSRHKLLKIKTELRTSHGFLKISENGQKQVGSTERLPSWVEQLLLFWAGSDSNYSPNDLFSDYGSWLMDLFRRSTLFFFLSLSSHSIPWCQRIAWRMDSHHLFLCHFIHELAHWSLWFFIMSFTLISL